jgi:hypothetical protein
VARPYTASSSAPKVALRKLALAASMSRRESRNRSRLASEAAPRLEVAAEVEQSG